MARFAIDSGTVIHLASASVEVSPEDKLHVPTLWRSETLTALYEAVRLDGHLLPDAIEHERGLLDAFDSRTFGHLSDTGEH